MYSSLFNIINELVYNGTAVVGTVHYDVATLIATVGCCALIILPFAVMIRVVLLVTGGWK